MKKYYAIGDSIVSHQGSHARVRTFSDCKATCDMEEHDIADIVVRGYVQEIEDRFGLVATNYGHGGHTIVQDLDELLGLDYTQATLVTVAYGINDARLGIPLGESDSFDVTTFAGAYNTLLDKIYSQNPECRVVMLTPIQRLRVNNFGVLDRNKNGNLISDFVDMCLEIGGKWSTVCIDMYRTCGLNQNNLAHYTVDGVHPTNLGYVRMAETIIPVVERYFK